MASVDRIRTSLKDIIEERPLSALMPQQRNANKHTQRGMGMLENSIQQVGWIGAGTMAANGEIFDGSARFEKADLLEKDAIIVKTDGTKPVYVMRTDIESASDEKAIKAGIAANRVAEVNLEWDSEVLVNLNDEGLIDIDDYWLPHEMNVLLGDEEEGNPSPEELWEGMPEFDQPDASAPYSIKVNFYTVEDIADFAQLVGQTVTENTKFINHPKVENIPEKRYQVQ